MRKAVGLIGAATVKSGFVSVILGLVIIAVPMSSGSGGRLSLEAIATWLQVGSIVTAVGVVLTIVGLFLMAGAEVERDHVPVPDHSLRL